MITNQPIRVLHVIGIMNRGGAETMIMNLYRKIDRNKVQFDFVENSYERAAFDDEIESLGGIIYRCPHFNGKNYFQYKKWWHSFFQEHKEEYNIIHGHLGSTAAIYLKIAKQYGIYTIAHSHSSGNDHSFGHYLYQMMSYNTRHIADYFFACSKVAGLDRYGRKVVSGNHFSVLNNAIDTTMFSFDKEIRNRVRKEMSLENNVVIGHIGRLIPVKNHKFLFLVFQSISSKVENAKLLCVGDGELKENLEQLARDMSIEDKVVFTGVRSDVNEIIQAMDFFVFPSIYEGLPVTLVEVQASGLPCVISDKVPSESIITKELVTVKSLDHSPEEWAEHIIGRLGEKRFSRVDEIIANGYDISKTSEELLNFYLSIRKNYEQ